MVKNGQGKGVTWSLPATSVADEEFEQIGQGQVGEGDEFTPVAPREEVRQIVSEIPSFTEGHITTLAVPNVRVISREIRRAKSKLAKLERLRDAVRIVGRHKHIVQQLVNAEVENGKA